MTFWYMFGFAACILALSIGFYLYMIAMGKCIKGNLIAISQTGNAKNNRNLMLKQIIDFIAFDTSVKQLRKIWKKNILTQTKFCAIHK